MANSWQTNRDQAGNQLFYYVNNFHDYLRDTPGIGFGPSSGNFENADAVDAQVEDGADLLEAGNNDYATTRAWPRRVTAARR